MILELFFDELKVTVQSEDSCLIDNVKRDLSYFTKQRQEIAQNILIEASKTEPDYSVINQPHFFNHFDGATVYGFGDIRYAKYDKALLFFDSVKNIGSVTSVDDVLLHQYVYYMIISKSGEFFDLKGVHRFHSLGVSLNGKGIVFPMYREGGKTTLALEIMKRDGVKIFSEDTPLISKNLQVKPFPARFAVRLCNKTNFFEKFIRIIKEPFFGHKKLVDIEYFGDNKVEEEPIRLEYVFIGIKNKLDAPSVKKMNRLYFFIYLLDCFVKGKQFPQRAELLLRISPRGLVTLSKICLSRFIAAINMSLKVKPYLFYMSENIDKNIDFIQEFIN